MMKCGEFQWITKNVFPSWEKNRLQEGDTSSFCRLHKDFWQGFRVKLMADNEKGLSKPSNITYKNTEIPIKTGKGMAKTEGVNKGIQQRCSFMLFNIYRWCRLTMKSHVAISIEL